jgi:hypothetical protein
MTEMKFINGKKRISFDIAANSMVEELAKYCISHRQQPVLSSNGMAKCVV